MREKLCVVHCLKMEQFLQNARDMSIINTCSKLQITIELNYNVMKVTEYFVSF
jgi:hypothetical protein